MQTNTTKLEPGLTKRDCIKAIVSERRIARLALRNIESVVDSNKEDHFLVKTYRASLNPILIRNAEVIEARIAARKTDLYFWNDVLRDVGYFIRSITDDIDRLIPLNELFDILEVNPVDRSKVGATAGFREVVFIHGLEDSATHRNSEWKEGPLFKAFARCLDDMMKTNPELQKQMTDSLFGKGGLFEFVPTYSQTASGNFERNPPKLRLADEVDLAAKPMRA